MVMVKPKEDPVRAKIERVLVSQQEAVVILTTDDPEFQQRVLPVFVDLGQAMNIQVSLEGRMMGRPLTHDLFTNVLNEMGAIVERIVIEDLAQNTFFATLHVEIEKNGKREKVSFDARPSDCLALAVRSGAAIHVRRKVLDQATVERDKFLGPKGQAQLGGPASRFGAEEDAEEESEESEPEEGDEDEDFRPPPKKRGGRIDPGEAERP